MDILAIIGVVAFAIGWAWLAITAFQKGNYFWGILIILFRTDCRTGFLYCQKNRVDAMALYVIGMIFLSVGL